MIGSQKVLTRFIGIPTQKARGLQNGKLRNTSITSHVQSVAVHQAIRSVSAFLIQTSVCRHYFMIDSDLELYLLVTCIHALIANYVREME